MPELAKFAVVTIRGLALSVYEIGAERFIDIECELRGNPLMKVPTAQTFGNIFNLNSVPYFVQAGNKQIECKLVKIQDVISLCKSEGKNVSAQALESMNFSLVDFGEVCITLNTVQDTEQ